MSNLLYIPYFKFEVPAPPMGLLNLLKYLLTDNIRGWCAYVHNRTRISRASLKSLYFYYISNYSTNKFLCSSDSMFNRASFTRKGNERSFLVHNLSVFVAVVVVVLLLLRYSLQWHTHIGVFVLFFLLFLNDKRTSIELSVPVLFRYCCWRCCY